MPLFSFLDMLFCRVYFCIELLGATFPSCPVRTSGAGLTRVVTSQLAGVTVVLVLGSNTTGCSVSHLVLNLQSVLLQ